MNICAQNSVGKCVNKCSLQFNYKESNSTLSNSGTSLQLSYEPGGSTITYNGQSYTVYNAFITSPSLHTFQGEKKPGELVIVHTPVLGGSSLYIAIPFVSSSETSTASEEITNIISKAASYAPRSGETTTLSFSLASVVPTKPFFMYTDDVANIDWIVYGSMNAIPISSATVTSLSSLLEPSTQSTGTGTLYYNSKGPQPITTGDGIYISCQAVGESKETTPVSYQKNATNNDLFQSNTLQLILFIIAGVLGLVVVFYLLQYFYSYLQKGKGVSSSNITGK